jgi:hypothetical protein
MAKQTVHAVSRKPALAKTRCSPWPAYAVGALFALGIVSGARGIVSHPAEASHFAIGADVVQITPEGTP